MGMLLAQKRQRRLNSARTIVNNLPFYHVGIRTQPVYVVGKLSGSLTMPSTMELNNFGASYVCEIVLGNTFLLNVMSLRVRLLRK